MEHFGCKLCIGGHKHTYALSYPIKENYKWKTEENNDVYDDSDVDDDGFINSIKTRKPMFETLEDESGEKPKYEILWEVKTNKDEDNNLNPYNVKVTGDVIISSTKTPYIPRKLYEEIGEHATNYNNDYYICCTPTDTTNNDNYDGFVNYSMCQATGYKLKSNKELPCQYQVFSKIIPLTDHSGSSDKPNANQLYPMYSILEFKYENLNEYENNNINAINVKMCRIKNIFASNGKDSFTQTSYGKNEPSIEYLIEVNKENVGIINESLGLSDESEIKEQQFMYGAWVGDLLGESNKYLYIKY